MQGRQLGHGWQLVSRRQEAVLDAAAKVGGEQFVRVLWQPARRSGRGSAVAIASAARWSASSTHAA